MQFYNLITISLFIVTLTTADAVNYCNIWKCGKDHIACHNNAQISKRCPHDAKLVTFNDLKSEIVKMHNTMRNEFAGGKPPLEPASRMMEMRWCDELAYLAKLNAMTCSIEHDKCRSTEKFQYSGQNKAKVRFDRNTNYTDEYAISQAVAIWEKEASKCSQNMIKKSPHTILMKIKTCGNFMVMVNERNSHVGCAAMHYKTNVVVTCNYGYDNIDGKSVYTFGAPTSECKSGISVDYKNLCSINEVY